MTILLFDTVESGAAKLIPAAGDGFLDSPTVGSPVRLIRRATRAGMTVFRLEIAERS